MHSSTLVLSPPRALRALRLPPRTSSSPPVHNHPVSAPLNLRLLTLPTSPYPQPYSPYPPVILTCTVIAGRICQWTAGVSARSHYICFRGWDLDTVFSVWCSVIPSAGFFIKGTQIEKLISPARRGRPAGWKYISRSLIKRAKFLLWWVLQSSSTTMITKSTFY